MWRGIAKLKIERLCPPNAILHPSCHRAIVLIVLIVLIFHIPRSLPKVKPQINKKNNQRWTDLGLVSIFERWLMRWSLVLKVWKCRGARKKPNTEIPKGRGGHHGKRTKKEKWSDCKGRKDANTTACPVLMLSQSPSFGKPLVTTQRTQRTWRVRGCPHGCSSFFYFSRAKLR